MQRTITTITMCSGIPRPRIAAIEKAAIIPSSPNVRDEPRRERARRVQHDDLDSSVAQRIDKTLLFFSEQRALCGLMWHQPNFAAL